MIINLSEFFNYIELVGFNEDKTEFNYSLLKAFSQIKRAIVQSILYIYSFFVLF